MEYIGQGSKIYLFCKNLTFFGAYRSTGIFETYAIYSRSIMTPVHES